MKSRMPNILNFGVNIELYFIFIQNNKVLMWTYFVSIAISIVISIYVYVSRINIEEILLKAGVNIVYEKSNARSYDVVMHNMKAKDYFMSGNLGFMESYMKGYWSCQDLKLLFEKLETAKLHKLELYTIPQLIFIGLYRLWIRIKGFNEKDAQLVGLQHYDLPQNMYEAMLGSTMNYSCAYFKDLDSNDLDLAQYNKMELICQKLKLFPGMTVLDIGCGWGTLAYHLVTKYHVNVTAITISKEQLKYCQEKYSHPNLTYKLQDYRNIIKDGGVNTTSFDRIVSVGMFEHVTSSNYEIYFRTCMEALKPDGLFLLHTITGDESHLPGEGNRFIMKYIFPNSQLPSLSQITKALSYKFVVEDVQNFGLYYAKTLENWRRNFEDYLINNEMSETFIRMWTSYLIISQIGFERNRIFLHQFILSKGLNEVYKAVR